MKKLLWVRRSIQKHHVILKPNGTTGRYGVIITPKNIEKIPELKKHSSIQEVNDEEVIDEEVNDEEVNNEEVNDEEVNDEVNDEEVNDEWVNDEWVILFWVSEGSYWRFLYILYLNVLTLRDRWLY